MVEHKLECIVFYYCSFVDSCNFTNKGNSILAAMLQKKLFFFLKKSFPLVTLASLVILENFHPGEQRSWSQTKISVKSTCPDDWTAHFLSPAHLHILISSQRYLLGYSYENTMFNNYFLKLPCGLYLDGNFILYCSVLLWFQHWFPCAIRGRRIIVSFLSGEAKEKLHSL